MHLHPTKEVDLKRKVKYLQNPTSDIDGKKKNDHSIHEML